MFRSKYATKEYGAKKKQEKSKDISTLPQEKLIIRLAAIAIKPYKNPKEKAIKIAAVATSSGVNLSIGCSFDTMNMIAAIAVAAAVYVNLFVFVIFSFFFLTLIIFDKLSKKLFLHFVSPGKTQYNY
jgi:hypothetical protein